MAAGRVVPAISAELPDNHIEDVKPRKLVRRAETEPLWEEDRHHGTILNMAPVPIGLDASFMRVEGSHQDLSHARELLSHDRDARTQGHRRSASTSMARVPRATS
jgi:hypothetical protein